MVALKIGEVGWKRMVAGCWRMERNSSRASAGVDLGTGVQHRWMERRTLTEYSARRSPERTDVEDLIAD